MTNANGRPTVIWPNGQGLRHGRCGRVMNITHQQKKMDDRALKAFRDRFNIPVSDADLPAALPSTTPGGLARGEVHAGAPRRPGRLSAARRMKATRCQCRPLSALERPKSPGEREISTTMAFVRGLNLLLRDKKSVHIVPIVADEAHLRHGGHVRQIGIYAPSGRSTARSDADQLLYYRETLHGQMLQEGITEPARCRAGSPRRPATAATTCRCCRSSSSLDVRHAARGRFAGRRATCARGLPRRRYLAAPRSTAKGLQHEDGHSHLLAGAIPNCRAYDPTFSYEVAVILQDGMRRHAHRAGGRLLPSR